MESGLVELPAAETSWGEVRVAGMGGSGQGDELIALKDNLI